MFSCVYYCGDGDILCVSLGEKVSPEVLMPF